MKTLFERFANWLIKLATATPYRHISDYMQRFWLVPYKDEPSFPGQWPLLGRILGAMGIAVRVHHILRSDDDRAFHDHPMNFISVILRGSYTEVTPVYTSSGLYLGERRKTYKAGSILHRKAADWHRLELEEGETVWTLFITGPWKQNWGFLTTPAYKTYYRDYADAEPVVAPKSGLAVLTSEGKMPEQHQPVRVPFYDPELASKITDTARFAQINTNTSGQVPPQRNPTPQPVEAQPFPIVGLTGGRGAGKDTVGDYLVREYGFVKLAFADALREEVLAAFPEASDFMLHERDQKEKPSYRLRLSTCKDQGFIQAILLSENGTAGNETAYDFFDQPRSARWIMQRWGTEYRRAQAPDYWTKRMEEAIKLIVNARHKVGAPKGIVITDIRFPNELHLVERKKGRIFNIERDQDTTVDHVSDRRVIGANSITVENNGSLAELYRLMEYQMCCAGYGLAKNKATH